MGQPADEYWNGDPNLAVMYRQAHNIKLEEHNQELWMQGIYIMNAFSTVIGNAFGGKGKKKQKYFEEPIRITPLTKAEREEKERKEWERIDRALHMMKAEQDARKAKKK